MRFVAGLVVGAAAGFVAAALVSGGWADSGERGEVLPSGTLRLEGEVPNFWDAIEEGRRERIADPEAVGRRIVAELKEYAARNGRGGWK